MGLFASSDFHFDCEHLIRNCTAFKTVAEWNEYVIDRTNSKVQRNDTLLLLGDLCKGRPFKWRQQIRCKQVRFVVGNHDNEAQCRQAFGSIWHQLVVKLGGGKKVWCSHYPTAFWEKYHSGWWHFYGHIHSKHEAWLDRAFPGRRSMDVSVWNAKKLIGDYAPFSLDEIMGFIGARPGHYIVPEEERWDRKDYDGKEAA